MIDWTFTTKEELRQLYHELGGIAPLAKRLGVSNTSLRKKMTAEHIPYIAKGPQPTSISYRLEAIPRCKRLKMSLKQIVIALDCSVNTVRKHLKEEKK